MRTQTQAKTIRVEIRTDDPTFTEEGRDGRKVVDVVETGRRTVKVTGYEMVQFTLQRVPSDWWNARGVGPVEWIVG